MAATLTQFKLVLYAYESTERANVVILVALSLSILNAVLNILCHSTCISMTCLCKV